MYYLSQNIPRVSVENKSAGGRVLWYVVISLVLLAGIGIFIFTQQKTYNPIPVVEISKDLYKENLLNLSINPEPIKLNFDSADSTDSLIAGVSGILLDTDTGEILYAKNARQRMPLASLVKIMTAVVVLEHKNPTEYATVTKESAAVGENEMGISEGEAYTIEELLYGLLLNSGNDAAYALAENVTGSVDEFVVWMNRKVSEIGLKDTKFYDPSGLDDRSYTTATDLAVLTEYALRFDRFRETVRTVTKELPYSNKHKYLYLENQTNLLTTYPGVLGVKTGYTEEAGLCLSTYAENGGKRLIGVVLNSIDRKGDMILMLDYGFSKYGLIVEHNLLNRN